MKPKNKVIAALDIGSSKICCLIAESVMEDGQERLRVLGIGHHAASGIRAGTPVHIEQARQAIGAAVQQAEEQAGFRIEKVLVSVSGGQIASETVRVRIPLSGSHDISDMELKKLLAMAVPSHGSAGRLVLHKLPLRYVLDDQTLATDPRGMFAHSVTADVHLISLASAMVRTLTTCIRHIHLEVERFILSPYASGAACLTEDEKALGVTVLDLGGGTTGMAVYQEGNLVFADVLPIGGQHITRDLAHGLSTSEVNAERLKTLHGTALASGLEDLEFLDVPMIGETENIHTSHIPRSYLSRIIQPRVEEIFEMVRSRLEETNFNKSAGRLVVLTGGGSQLPVIRDAAAVLLDKKVRLGKPQVLSGLPITYQEAPFSTAVGLLLHGLTPPLWQTTAKEKPLVTPNGNALQKAVWWLKENF